MKIYTLFRFTLLFTLAFDLIAQNNKRVDYKKLTFDYSKSNNEKVYSLESGSALRNYADFQIASISTFTIGVATTYGIGVTQNLNGSDELALLGYAYGMSNIQQSLNLIGGHKLVLSGRTLLSDTNFRFTDYSNPEIAVNINKILKRHPGTLLIKAGRNLKTSAIFNLTTPLAGVGFFMIEQNIANSGSSIDEILGVSAFTQVFSIISIGTIFDFSAYNKIAKAGKILQNHSSININQAGKQLKIGARFHKIISLIPIIAVGAFVANDYSEQNISRETYINTNYAIGFTSSAAMLTLGLVSAAKIRKAGKLIAGQ